MADETDRHGGWTVMTVRADGTVEASSAPMALFAPAGRVPDGVVALLPTEHEAARGRAPTTSLSTGSSGDV